MDAFYASVEIRDNPRSPGYRSASADPRTSRGVIAAASYAARRSACTRRCRRGKRCACARSLVLLPPDFDKYFARSAARSCRSSAPTRRWSSRSRWTRRSSTSPAASACSATRSRHRPRDQARHPARDRARRFGRRRTSKFLAKLASDLSKPDGFRVVRPTRCATSSIPLPVSEIYGVGPRTAQRLESMGVTTVGDLALARRGRGRARAFGASGAWIHDSRTASTRGA